MEEYMADGYGPADAMQFLTPESLAALGGMMGNAPMDPATQQFLQQMYLQQNMRAKPTAVAPQTKWDMFVAISKSAVSFFGGAAWILATTGILVVLPLVMELEREYQYDVYEKDQLKREQGGQQMIYPGNHQKDKH